MSEASEYKGLWWLPGNPEQKIPGQLTLTSNKEATLELEGRFLSNRKVVTEGFGLALLLGQSRSERITLRNCYQSMPRTRFVAGSDVSYVSQISANDVLIGTHFDTEEAIRFRKLSVHYTNLDEWVITENYYKIKDKNERSAEFVIQYKRPQATQIRVDNHDISIGIAIFRDTSLTQVNVTQKAWMDISFEQERPLDECFSFLYHIQNFLCLAMGVPAYPLEIVGRTETKEKVQICRYIGKWAIEAKSVHRINMLFTLTDVQEQLESHLCNWIEKAELLKPVYDLFFGTLYNPYLYVQSRFLNLIQAIEAYHRRRYVGKYQPDEDYRKGLYQKLVAAIPSEVDNDFRQSLKDGKLYYANEYSLRKRLLELINMLTSDIRIWFLAYKNLKEDFVKKVCDTRNYLTHYDPESPPKAVLQSSELHKLSQQLQIILQLCLLKEMGFDSEVIGRLLRKIRQRI